MSGSPHNVILSRTLSFQKDTLELLFSLASEYLQSRTYDRVMPSLPTFQEQMYPSSHTLTIPGQTMMGEKPLRLSTVHQFLANTGALVRI